MITAINVQEETFKVFQPSNSKLTVAIKGNNRIGYFYTIHSNLTNNQIIDNASMSDSLFKEFDMNYNTLYLYFTPGNYIMDVKETL